MVEYFAGVGRVVLEGTNRWKSVAVEVGTCWRGAVVAKVQRQERAANVSTLLVLKIVIAVIVLYQGILHVAHAIDVVCAPQSVRALLPLRYALTYHQVISLDGLFVYYGTEYCGCDQIIENTYPMVYPHRNILLLESDLLRHLASNPLSRNHFEAQVYEQRKSQLSS